MTSLESKDGKFWRIGLAGKSFTIVSGKIGSAGRKQTKSFASAAATRKEHDRLVADKLKKGFVAKKKRKAVPPSPQVALENALAAHPDDLGAHAAYADYLLEQGDPRGEFIQIQLALEDESKPAQQRKELQKREQALLKKHGKAWLGNLAEYIWKKKEDEAVYSFERGWLDFVGVALLTGPLARTLAKAPEVRLLSSLTIASIDSVLQHLLEDRRGKRDYPGLDPLVDAPNLANIRHLTVGFAYDLRESHFIYDAFSLNELDGVIPLVASLPNLERLALEGRLREVHKLFSMKSLHGLVSLQLCFSQECPLDVLARNRSLGKLRYVMFHAQDDAEPAITLKGLRALVESPHLKSLEKIRLHKTDFGDKGCEVIVRSGVLKRLKILDLGFGNITDDGARILANCPDLNNLALLDLQRNALTKKGIALLRKACEEVIAEDQHDSDDLSYLFDGEME